MGESILDCHAVQGIFSKTFGRFLRPKSASKAVPRFPGMSLLLASLPQMVTGWEQPVGDMPSTQMQLWYLFFPQVSMSSTI